VKQDATGIAAVEGIIVHDSEILEPEPVRQGGLVRDDKVRTEAYVSSAVLSGTIPEAYISTSSEAVGTPHTQNVCAGPRSFGAGETQCYNRQ
jgi:hypothetical protein